MPHESSAYASCIKRPATSRMVLLHPPIQTDPLPDGGDQRNWYWLPWLMAFAVWAQAFYIIPTTIYWTLRAIHPIPYWDSWEIVKFLAQGQPVTLSWLWHQHNEHRILIQRLISLVDYRLFRGRGYLDLSMSWLMQTGSALLMTSLSFDAIGRARAMRPWRILVCGLIICLAFSAAQMENFYWSFQTCFVGMIFFSILAFFCLKKSVETHYSSAWIAGGALAAMASALCLSSGMITVIIFAAGCCVARVRGRVRFLVVLVSLAFTAAYLHGYNTPAHHGAPIEALHHPVLIFQYFFVYLGNPWINQTIPCAIMGSWGLELFLLAILFTPWGGLLSNPRSRSDDDNLLSERQPLEPVAPAALALFSVAVLIVGQDFITALGRYVLGVEQAFSSRYVTPVSFFWMATLVLVLGLILQKQLSHRFILALCVLILLLVSKIASLDGGIGRAAAGRVEGLEIAANSLRVGVIDVSALGQVYPRPNEVVAAKPFLLQHRLSIFSDDRYSWVGQPIERVAKTSSADACLGYFDPVSSKGVIGGARVSGWAWSRQEKKGPSQIILADGAGVIVGLATGRTERTDVVAVIPEVKDPTTGWLGYAKYAHAVSAYALIDGDREACRLQGSFDITPPPSAP
jgi:hypothetical protein